MGRRDVPFRDGDFEDLASAVKQAQPIGKITQDRGAKFSVVNTKSPYVIIDGGRDDFEMIAVSGKKGQEYHFELRSLCNCLGFRKLILSPVSFC